jgi:hypothetical protein
MTTFQSAHSGYADINGMAMYHEVTGAGRPLVLLHGGMLTIELCSVIAGARLAVLPDTTHSKVMGRTGPLLLMLDAFL